MTLFPADSGSGLSLRIFLNIAPQVAIPIGCSHHICCKDCCHSEEQILGEAVGVSGGLMGVAGALNGGGADFGVGLQKKRIFQVERSTLQTP